MIQVINEEIKQYSLPKVGTLSTGETVSGYHLLDEEILLDEGWLPLEDNPPEYDVETQYLAKVIQEHTSLENWVPSELPALYLNLMPENVIPEWVQPTGSHDAYNVGDKVIYKGKVYECIINDNTWSPTDYPQGWEEADR